MKFVIFLKSGLLFSISYWLLWTKFLRCSDLKLKQLWIRNFQGLLFVLKRPFFCFLNNFQYCVLNLLLSMYFIIWKIGYHTQICFKGVSKDCLVSNHPYVVVGSGIRFLFFGKIIPFVFLQAHQEVMGQHTLFTVRSHCMDPCVFTQFNLVKLNKQLHRNASWLLYSLPGNTFYKKQ